jgi:hypothetical protein
MVLLRVAKPHAALSQDAEEEGIGRSVARMRMRLDGGEGSVNAAASFINKRTTIVHTQTLATSGMR